MILFSLVAGIVAYLAVCLVRLKQLPKATHIHSIWDMVYGDFESILSIFKKKEEIQPTTNSLPKPVLRRGNSSNEKKGKQKLTRTSSVRGASYNGISIPYHNHIIEKVELSKDYKLSPPVSGIDSPRSIREVVNGFHTKVQSPSIRNYFTPIVSEYLTPLP